MTILDQYGQPFQQAEIEQRSSTFSNPEEWFLEYLTGGKSTSGERVNARAAMTVMTFFACVRNISEDFAKTPRKVRRRVGGKKQDAYDYPLQNVFQYPNDYTDRHTFWQTFCAHALTHIGGFAEIEFGPDGRPIALHLIDPATVTIECVRGQLLYHVVIDGYYVTLMQYQVLHMHGLGYDSVTGYNVPRLANELLGVALALQKYQGSYFGNNAVPSGVLEHPSTLNSAAAERLREQFQQRHAGAGNRGRPLLLEEGMKWTQISIDPEKSQMSEFAKVTWLDICRIFRMPPHKVQLEMVGGLTVLEQQDRQYYTDTLDPWFDKFRSEADFKLYPAMDRGLGYHTAVVTRALQRADTAVQDAHFKEGFYTGRYSIDDIREWEDLPPLPDGQGQRRFTQRNLIPLDRLDELLDKELAVGAKAPDSGDEQPGAKQSQPDAPAAEDNTRARDAKVMEGFEKLIATQIARILHSEADKASRATNMDDFYKQNEKHVEAKVMEVSTVVATAISSQALAEHIASRYAEIHCEKSKNDILVGDLAAWQNGKRAAAAAHWIMEQLVA